MARPSPLPPACRDRAASPRWNRSKIALPRPAPARRARRRRTSSRPTAVLRDADPQLDRGRGVGDGVLEQVAHQRAAARRGRRATGAAETRAGVDAGPAAPAAAGRPPRAPRPRGRPGAVSGGAPASVRGEEQQVADEALHLGRVPASRSPARAAAVGRRRAGPGPPRAGRAARPAGSAGRGRRRRRSPRWLAGRASSRPSIRFMVAASRPTSSSTPVSRHPPVEAGPR